MAGDWVPGAVERRHRLVADHQLRLQRGARAMLIRWLAGPLYPDQDYEMDREVVALSGSRRTESVWIRSRVYAPGAPDPLAVVLLNSAYL